MTTLLSNEHPLVRQARSDAARFYDANPEGFEFDHVYGDARVRTRDATSPEGLRVFVYDAHGHPLGNPMWDSSNPTA